MTGITARATVHGAISIVNAVATGLGAALGVSLQTIAEVELSKGQGIRFVSGKSDDSLITAVVRKSLSKKLLDEHQVLIRVRSEIPIGCGLKSSSAVSSAVALACTRLLQEDVDDFSVLEAGAAASLETGVSITGAYDDACACYFGGFVVTDNQNRKLLERKDAPEDLYAVIFLPRHARRGDVKKLKTFSELFEIAFRLARDNDYWKAMKLNGTLMSAAMSTRYDATLAAIESGAISASISGNGPSTAAIAHIADLERIKSAVSNLDGRILSSKINNRKASVELMNHG